MAYFRVDTNGLSNASNELLNIIQQCNTAKNNTQLAARGLTGSNAIMLLARVKVNNRASDIMKEIFMLNQLRISLNSIIEAYENIENKILGNADANGISIEEARSIVFGTDKGKYGGDQGHPLYEKNPKIRQQYRDIVERNIGRKLTNNEFEAFLTRMNSEGCGFVAMVNAMMVYFISHPDKYNESEFGFPLYDKDGNPNFDMMLVDYYSKTDNRNQDGSFNFFDDYDNGDENKRKYDYWMDNDGSGTTQYDREYNVEWYMSQHGIEVDAKTDVHVTPENFQRLVDEGKTITIAYHDGIIYNSNNEPHVINGGHAMTVTGVTEDGRFIVSSWGEEYYLDPNEDTGMDTTMTFSTIEYNT